MPIELESDEEIEVGHKVAIYLMRHGNPNYEADKLRSLDSQQPIQFEGELTKEGMIQIELASRKLAKKFGDMPKTVILTSSPRRRAVESLNVLKGVFEKYEISVSQLELEEVQKLLTDTALTGELLEEYGKRSEQDEDLTWMEFWINESGNFKNVENAADFEKRMKSLILYFQNFSQKVDLSKNEAITIVCLTHEEEIKILASIFGISILIVPNGGILKMTIDPEEREMIVEVQGEVERLNFEQFDMKEERR